MPGDDPSFRWTNPVVRGLAPDPSVIRVGRDYYLATSTFDHMPGTRLWHSVDLVDWVNFIHLVCLMNA